MLDEPSLASRRCWSIRSSRPSRRSAARARPSSQQNTRRALAAAQRAYVLVTGEVVLSGEAETLAQDPRVKGAYLGEGVHLE
ncbi:MAG: hypothetical protein R3A52_14140 [Polyangiales bacterium]